MVNVVQTKWENNKGEKLETKKRSQLSAWTKQNIWQVIFMRVVEEESQSWRELRSGKRRMKVKSRLAERFVQEVEAREAEGEKKRPELRNLVVGSTA